MPKIKEFINKKNYFYFNITKIKEKPRTTKFLTLKDVNKDLRTSFR